MRTRLILIPLFCLLAATADASDSPAILGAPRLTAAANHRITLQLPSVECGPTYRVEVSFDQLRWRSLGTTVFGKTGGGAPTEQRCMRDFTDDSTRVSKEMNTLYYRYAEIEGGKIVHRSEIGTVDVAKELNSYWN